MNNCANKTEILAEKIVFLDDRTHMTGDQLIDQLQTITKENILFVEKKLTHLSEEQVNWKPQPDHWSIVEVFAHLNEYSSFYHASFQRCIAKTKFKKPTQNFISSPLGAAAWKSMKLGNAKNIKRKFRALAAYNPTITPGLVKGKDWMVFLENQHELLSTLDLARSVNIRKAKTALSISKIIKFRLGDAMNFVVYHNERHLQQVKNILSHPNFPKKK